MKLLNSTKKKIVAAGIATTLVASTGIATAWWTSTGNGSGSATTGEASAWLVETEAAEGGPLTPGGPEQTVAYTVTNESTGHQNLDQVVVSIADTDPDTGAAVAWTAGDCDASDFALDTENAGDAATHLYDTDLDADEFESGSVTIALVNLDEDQDDCQGVTVPLYFAAS